MKKRQTMTLKGFAARDENGYLFFYPGDVKPVRTDFGVWEGGVISNKYIAFPEENFDISWKDEPREAILTMHLDVESK